ncbi:sensor histidine kinase [Paractinoplanes toevensis]|uniref:sensor histidine kinase n=1 Tax=Paractinoplanes toevensis TaxID=571911 RepID=UPI001BB459FD|nr:HAMP domain-containing sensor histidine kinase [Actinoplanes toevensis]
MVTAVPVPEPARLLDSAALSRLGHDLRSPLTGIIGLAGLMRRKITCGGADPVQQDRQLQLIADSATGLLATIERVVALAKLETRDDEPPGSTDCGTVAAEVVAELTPAAVEHGRRLHASTGPAPAAITPAAARLIVTELLDNAIKYSTEADIEVTVTGAAISVADHGPGLPAGEQQRIFQPFERGTAAEEREVAGSGLGLALAQRATVRHGGTLGMATGPDGTVFTVTLPRA